MAWCHQTTSHYLINVVPNLYWVIHRGQNKMGNIFQTTFSNAFSWMKMYEFHFRFHWILFLRFQLTISQHWFRSWLGADQVTSHYLNQLWLVYWCIYESLRLHELTYQPGGKQRSAKVIEKWGQRQWMKLPAMTKSLTKLDVCTFHYYFKSLTAVSN